MTESTREGSDERSTEELDLMARSTKKFKIQGAQEGNTSMEDQTMIVCTDKDSDELKTRDCEMRVEDVNEDAEASEEGSPKVLPRKLTYKETVLYEGLSESLQLEEVAKAILEDYFIPDPSEEEALEDTSAPFNPKLVVNVSLEEYDEWCRPWKLTPIVKLMGKR